MSKFSQNHEDSPSYFTHWRGTRGDDFVSYLDSNVPVHASGKNGNDQIYGGNGNDILDGDNGDDGLIGSDGNDLLRGGRGDDVLIDFSGSNVLFGGRGDDIIFFGPDALVVGGLGHDTFSTTTNTAAGFSQIDFHANDVLQVDAATRDDIGVLNGVLTIKEFNGELLLGGVFLIIKDVDAAIADGHLVLIPPPSIEPIHHFDMGVL